MTYELPEPTRYFCYDTHEGWYSTDKATFNRADDRFAAYSETQMQAAYAQGRADMHSLVMETYDAPYTKWDGHIGDKLRGLK